MRPQTINGVQIYPDGREVCLIKRAAGQREYHRRLMEMVTRQGNICAICGNKMWSTPTFEHEAGKGLSGAHRDDRIEINGRWHNAAAHGNCNLWKGSKRFQWVDGHYLPVKRTAA